MNEVRINLNVYIPVMGAEASEETKRSREAVTKDMFTDFLDRHKYAYELNVVEYLGEEEQK